MNHVSDKKRTSKHRVVDEDERGELKKEEEEGELEEGEEEGVAEGGAWVERSETRTFHLSRVRPLTFR